MSDDVQALHARVNELTGRVNLLNLEKMKAEYRARRCRWWFMLTIFAVFADMFYTYAFFGRLGIM